MRRALPLLALVALLPAAPRAQGTPEPEVFMVVDQMPELIGGLATIQPTYPERERRAGIEDRVFLQFIVNEDGSVSDIEVTRPVSPGLDSAAVAAVRGARFRPGIQDGRPVRVRFSLPVNFRLTDDGRPPPPADAGLPPPTVVVGPRGRIGSAVTSPAPFTPGDTPPGSAVRRRPQWDSSIADEQHAIEESYAGAPAEAVYVTPERPAEPQGGWGRLSTPLPAERLRDGDSTYVVLLVDSEGAWMILEAFGGIRSAGEPPHADIAARALAPLVFLPARHDGEDVTAVLTISFSAEWSGSTPYLRAAPVPFPFTHDIPAGVLIEAQEMPRPPGGLEHFTTHVPYPHDVPPDAEDPTIVTMRFVVDTDGRVLVAAPAGEPPSPFSRAAAAALRGATFTPGRHNGVPVPVFMMEDFYFARPALQRG